MRVLRAVPATLLWVLASLLGLVGVLLCVTIVLLPVGLPLVKLASRLFKMSVQLFLPRQLAHPVKGLTKATKKERDKVGSAVSDAGDALKKGRKATRKQWKRVA